MKKIDIECRIKSFFQVQFGLFGLPCCRFKHGKDYSLRCIFPEKCEFFGWQLHRRFWICNYREKNSSNPARRVRNKIFSSFWVFRSFIFLMKGSTWIFFGRFLSTSVIFSIWIFVEEIKSVLAVKIELVHRDELLLWAFLGFLDYRDFDASITLKECSVESFSASVCVFYRYRSWKKNPLFWMSKWATNIETFCNFWRLKILTKALISWSERLTRVHFFPTEAFIKDIKRVIRQKREFERPDKFL